MSGMVWSLAASAALMCVLIVAVWLLQKRTKFGEAGKVVQCIIISAIFGTAAIIATHGGISNGGMNLSVSDMAPLAAGYFFNPAAALITGLISCADRFIYGTYMGGGTAAAMPGAIASVFAGLIGFVSGKFLFEGKKPSPFYALTGGALTEVIRTFVVFLFFVNQIETYFQYIMSSSIPVILCVAIGLCIADILLYILSGQLRRKNLKRNLSEIPVTKKLQFWLLVFITGAFLFTFALTYQAQTAQSISSAQSVLILNTRDVENNIKSNAENLERATKLLQSSGESIGLSVATQVTSSGGPNQVTSSEMKKLSRQYDVYEIDVINSKGIITASSNPKYVGFDMKKGEQSKAFMVLLDGSTKTYAQDFQPISYDSNISVMYVGVAMNGGFVQVGYDSASIDIVSQLADIKTVANSRRIGKNGFVFILKDDKVVSSTNNVNLDESMSELGVGKNNDQDTYFYANINSSPSYCYYENYGDYTVLLTMSKTEMYEGRNIITFALAMVEVLLFAFIYILIYVLVRRIIVRNLDKINESLSKITNGDLNETVDVRASMEFTSLSQDINSTVDTLKKYIKDAENRINKELEFAKEIQESALPNVFPPFPDHGEFDIFASMGTAKEVGGDFYDYFMTDDSHLVLVIADVSNKGIPASLFMMKSKTLIKSLAESGLSPAEVLTAANDELCEGNEKDMFVTVWIGYLDLVTGQLDTSNAGHEFPAIMHKGGDYEFFKDKHGLVLAGMPGHGYKEEHLILKPGDSIFLYTDGVTEATRSDKEMFGMDRLKDSLNRCKDMSPEQLLGEIRKDIDDFVGEAPQFDDITMLSVRLNEMNELKVDAETDNLEKVQNFIRAGMTAAGCPKKDIGQTLIAAEEIFVNIAHYAYAPDKGWALVKLSVDSVAGRVAVTFVDGGSHFDPLAKEDADTTLSADERKIGGLGILMVKKMMDEVSYSYENGKNILTMVKCFEPENTNLA